MKIKMITLLLLFFSVILVFFCEKQEKIENKAISQHEATFADSAVLTIKPKPVNYDSLFKVLANLVEAIKKNPTDITLRQQLVAAGYDTTWETILATGFGEPSSKANTQSISQKFAEQAAAADAYRWAIYIKKWYDNPNDPEFGTISAKVQGGRIVAREYLPDGRVCVLIEVKSINIP